MKLCRVAALWYTCDMVFFVQFHGICGIHPNPSSAAEGIALIRKANPASRQLPGSRVDDVGRGAMAPAIALSASGQFSLILPHTQEIYLHSGKTIIPFKRCARCNHHGPLKTSSAGQRLVLFTGPIYRNSGWLDERSQRIDDGGKPGPW